MDPHQPQGQAQGKKDRHGQASCPADRTKNTGPADPGGSGVFAGYGTHSIAIGPGSVSNGTGTIAIGESASATGDLNIAIGSDTGTATGSMGTYATMIGNYVNAGVGDDGTTSDWQVYEQTTGDGVTGTISKILCKEILAGRKSGVKVYNGALRRTAQEYFHAYADISGSKVFVPNEMTFNAADGIWDGQWIETDIDNSGQTFIDQDIVDSGATFVSTNNY